MDLPSVAGVYAANAAWRVTGARPAGRVLVRGLASPDESVRAISGMFLVQARDRSIPLLEEALTRGEEVPTILTILADIGDPATWPLVQRYSNSHDPEVARAAREALAVFHLHAKAARA